MNKTTIYFLRHGEVENPNNILYGRLPNFGLSKIGKERINQVKDELKSKKIDCIYSSPLLRTRETAQIINQVLRLPINISNLLIEVKLIHEGMPLETFKRDIQPYIYNDSFVQKGQESVKSQEKRMMSFTRMVQKKHPGKNILAVSHGDPIVILKAKISGIPFSWQFKRENYLKTGHFLTLVCEGSHYKFI